MCSAQVNALAFSKGMCSGVDRGACGIDPKRAGVIPLRSGTLNQRLGLGFSESDPASRTPQRVACSGSFRRAPQDSCRPQVVHALRAAVLVLCALFVFCNPSNLRPESCTAGPSWRHSPNCSTARPLSSISDEAYADLNTFNGSVNAVAQDPALAAVRTCDPDIARMRTEYETRREIMRTELDKIPGLTLSSSEGAFYQFPRYDLDLRSADVVAALRTSYGVAVRPGSEFGARGEAHLRLSYAADAESITEGVRRLAHGLAALEAR
ncbi:aminotransferase class I/II-fold pyridoxal phosphate-dependent enzyme [Streptomyces sp. NPDC024017]|uniref:aminotransferase class I/II-fold pyridoxal phosphate-dependent enzyme n=1 Tax=Streptomyces sp. NPDC024017 TaxID=3154326 RepID=UPI0033F0307F